LPKPTLESRSVYREDNDYLIFGNNTQFLYNKRQTIRRITHMSGVVKNIIGTTAQAAGSLVRDTPQRLYNVANLAWHYVPEGRGIKSAIQNTWENAPESTAMRAAGVFGATITGAIAAGTAAAIAPPLVALGIGTAGGLLLLNSDPRTSLKVASAAAASAATFVAIPAVAAAASVAAAETGVAAIAYAASLVPTSLVTASAGMAAIGTGAAVLAAENPERSLLVQFPGRSPRELRTVDLEPLVPLATNLTELERLSANFRTQHPPEMPAVLKESSRQVDPQVEWNRQKQQIQTNAAKDRLIANIAAYTSADFIFIKRLGLPRRSADGSNIVMQIAELASRQCDGKYPNLWDTCMGCLKQNGIRLTTIQWIRAKFWYFLSDTIGIVPNTFKEVGKSILKYLRGGVQPKQLPIDIARFIAIADSFLEKYKSAMKQYADAGQLGCPANTGGLADYQRNMVDELGEAGLVEIAKNHRKPGQNLGKVIIQDLCKEFVEAVVNDPEIFPSIPFFQKLQNISFKGIRFGAFFDPFAWVFGGIFNWVGKKIIKAYAPDIVQDIVKKGLYQVMPGNFTFKIAVANSLKAQIETLDIQFRLGIPTQPLRFIKNRKLNDVISKLLEILELTARKGNAASLRHTFRELEERENPTLANNQQLEEARKTNQDLNDALIEGAQFLIEHYTKNPEALEQLFEKLFELSNEAFHSGARVDTEEQYRHASDSLQAATKTLIGKLVEKTIREKAHGEDQDTIDKIFTGMHINEPANPIRRTPAIVINRQGVFNEHKEQAQKTAQLLAGLALKMSKELQADRDAPIAPTPQQPAMKVQDAEALLRTAQAAGQQTQLKQAEFQLEFAKAQTKYDDAKIHFQERRSGVDGANASDLPEAKFHLATATNEYEKAGLECEIAREKCRVAQEAERLEILIASTNDEISHAGNDPAVLAEMRKKLQDAETKLTYVREEEAPGNSTI
jgi:hypothetical protein